MLDDEASLDRRDHYAAVQSYRHSSAVSRPNASSSRIDDLGLDHIVDPRRPPTAIRPWARLTLAASPLPGLRLAGTEKLGKLVAMPPRGTDDDAASVARPASEGVVALERRVQEGALAKGMNVGLSPSEVIAKLLELDAMEPRNVRDEGRFERRHHASTIFYERTAEGIVLWRRPTRYKRRGVILDPFPYPDMVDIRIVAIARGGSRIELRWRQHPVTRFTTSYTVASNIAAVALMIYMFLEPRLFAGFITGLVILLMTVPSFFRAHAKGYRDRRALEPLVQRALTAFVPHELGPADIEDSAFRTLPVQSGAERWQRVDPQ